MLLLAACSAESSGGGGGTCTQTEPVECRTPDGDLVGCCPAAHPVCSPDGLKCLDFASGGAQNGGGSGGGGATGGNPNGGSGALGGDGGTPSGGTTSTGGGGFGATGGSGGFGATGASGGTGATGGGGTGGAPSCIDSGFEPNETEFDAYQLAAVTDCDGTGSSVSGKLDGQSDIDYYSFFGNDVGGCFVDPGIKTGAKVRLCVFVDCPGIAVSCSQGTPATSPDGNPGCCVPSGGSVAPTVDCNGFTEGATMYLRIDQGPSNQCTSYVVDYHY